MPLDFSIIVPTRNRPAELAECLVALSAMNYPPDRFEAIVVDDGSLPPVPQESGSIGAPRISILRIAHAGPSAARNAGAQVAQGAFLAFTDDDCLPAPEWLSALNGALVGRPAVMAGGKTVNALEENAFSAASQLIHEFVYAHYNQDPLRARFFASNNLAVHAQEYKAMGGFDPLFTTSEDRDFCDRWSQAGRPMIFVPGALVRHAHRLTLRGFWKQHVGYGRGAQRFRKEHRRRNPGTSTVDSRFYLRVLLGLPAALKSSRRPWFMACLLAVWQLANVTGFVLELLGAQRRAR